MGLAVSVWLVRESAESETLIERGGVIFSIALSLVDHALKLRPNDPNYLDTKGWVLFRAGKFDEAVTLLQTASAAQPENAEIRDHLDQARKASVRAVQLGKT